MDFANPCFSDHCRRGGYRGPLCRPSESGANPSRHKNLRRIRGPFKHRITVTFSRFATKTTGLLLTTLLSKKRMRDPFQKWAAEPRWYRVLWLESRPPTIVSVKCLSNRLFESAIVLAREGEPLSGALASAIKFKGDVLSRYPETKRIFTTRDADSMRKAIFFVSRSWPKH